MRTSSPNTCCHPHFGQCRQNLSTATHFSGASLKGLSVEDGAATLTAFSAAAIGKAREHFPRRLRCGSSRVAGGATRR